MTTTLWLRISSVLAMLLAIGHTLGGRKHWSPMADNPVLQAMTATRFDTMGVSRSYLDFYVGFGYSLSVAQVLLAVLLWQLASLARRGATSVRPMILAIAIATLANALIAWQFIFPLPAIMSAAILVPLAVAYAVAR